MMWLGIAWDVIKSYLADAMLYRRRRIRQEVFRNLDTHLDKHYPLPNETAAQWFARTEGRTK